MHAVLPPSHTREREQTAPPAVVAGEQRLPRCGRARHGRSAQRAAVEEARQRVEQVEAETVEKIRQVEAAAAERVTAAETAAGRAQNEAARQVEEMKATVDREQKAAPR
ncbi:hypothetical protein ACIRP5_33845 [Streptomyces sp. NPDC101221]|uniref:hypothetical protein n=1 Tax=Streptomyces sp. NPDC101221 TaxID=3366132 RepID=UPI00380BA9C6